jgi:hypothetical protein
MEVIGEVSGERRQFSSIASDCRAGKQAPMHPGPPVRRARVASPTYALDIVTHENKPGSSSLITGKITGNFLKFSPGCDIKIFSIYLSVPHLEYA